MKSLKKYIPISIIVCALGFQTAFAQQHEGHDKHRSAKSAETKLKPYPISTCLVSGEKFGGEMGEPYVHSYKGQEIKLCCKGCLKDFNKDPEKYIRQLEKAEKKK